MDSAPFASPPTFFTAPFSTFSFRFSTTFSFVPPAGFFTTAALPAVLTVRRGFGLLQNFHLLYNNYEIIIYQTKGGSGDKVP